MRKHFLLLFLMALLPLAGWAQNGPDPSSSSVPAANPVALPSDLQVTFTALTYNGEAQTPTIATASSATATTLVDGDVAIDKVYADQACTNPMTNNQVTNAGTYYVKVKGSGTNFTTTTLDKVFTLTVAKYGDIKVSAKALYKVYGDEYPTAGFFEATMPTNAPNDETAADAGLVVTPSFNSWETTKVAGVHQFTISVNTVTNYNVVVEVDAANLTINKRDLIVKAKDVTKSYGVNPRSDFGVTYGTTLVEGDETTFGDVTYTLKDALNAVVAETVEWPAQGIYTIIPSLEENANYNFTFETGTLTIGQRSLEDGDLTFNVTIPAMTYDGTPRKVLPTIVDAGLNKTLAKASTTGGDYILTYYTSEDNANANTVASDENLINAGTYYVKISGQNNYTGSIVRSYKVNQKSLWITSKNDSTTYTGVAIADYRTNLADYALFEGLVAADATNGLPNDNTYKGYGTENVASIKINMKKDNTVYDYSADAKKPVNAGDYQVVFAPSTSDNTAIFTNYKVVYIESGIHKIKPAELKFTVSQTLSKNNGETNVLDNGYTPTATDAETYFTAIEALVNNQVITTYPKLVLGEADANGDYPVNVDFTGLVIKTAASNGTVVDKKNYDLKFVAGLYTINKGQMAVRPINVTATYGDEEQELSVYAYGGSAEDNEAVAAFLQPALEIAEKGYPFNANGTVNTTATAEQMVTYPAAGQYFISFNTENVDAETLATWNEKYNFEYFNESTYTINKKAITIKLNQQSLMVGENASNLEANKNTVEFTGLIEGDKAEDLYDNIDFAFDASSILTDAYYDEDEVQSGAANYQATATSAKGYFANTITLATTTVFANYKYTAATDITKGDLYVSVNGGTLALDEKEVTDPTAGTISAADRLTAADNYKYHAVTVKLYRKQTIATKTYSWNAQQFNALVLPFDVTVSELASANAFGYAIVNVVNPEKTTEGNIYWSLEWGTIPANTPFVIRTIDDVDGTNGTMLTFSKKVVSYEEAPSVDAGEGYQVVGAYAPYVIDNTSASKQRFFGDNTDHGIGSSSAYTWTIYPFDAYLDYTGSTSAREVTLTFEDLNGGTTSISAAELTREAMPTAEGWYTVNGIKLQGVPTEKGIYIQNGKKVVIK